MPQPPTAPAGKPQSAGSVSGELSLGSHSLPVTHIKGGHTADSEGKEVRKPKAPTLPGGQCVSDAVPERLPTPFSHRPTHNVISDRLLQ